MKKLTFILVFCLTILLAAASQPGKAKYIFYFIGDGMGIQHIATTELYNAMKLSTDPQESRLNFTQFPVKSILTTYSANSLVTDSSAAGTALATGRKTSNLMVSQDSLGTQYKTITELASENGYGVGIVTNVAINHATPSVFYGHTKSRSQYNLLLEQLLASQVNFIAGSSIFQKKNKRTTTEGIEECVEKAQNAGFRVLWNPDEAGNVKNSRVMLLFDPLVKSATNFAIERPASDPNLKQFTKAAISYMERNHKDRFFLMVEGGKIDYACHNNDAVTIAHEINEFDECIALALEFYKKHPKETLIVVTADHETGGMSMGIGKYSLDLEKFRYQNISEDGLSRAIKNLRREKKETIPSWEEVKDVIAGATGLWKHIEVPKKYNDKLYDIYKKSIVEKGKDVVGLYSVNEQIAVEAIRVLNRLAQIGWSCRSHSGAPVPLYAIGVGQEKIGTSSDNTDVPVHISSVMGLKFR